MPPSASAPRSTKLPSRCCKCPEAQKIPRPANFNQSGACHEPSKRRNRGGSHRAFFAKKLNRALLALASVWLIDCNIGVQLCLGSMTRFMFLKARPSQITFKQQTVKSEFGRAARAITFPL